MEKTNTATRPFVFNPDADSGDPLPATVQAVLDGLLTPNAGGSAGVEATVSVLDNLDNVIDSITRQFNTSNGQLMVDAPFSLPLMLTPGETYKLQTALSLNVQDGSADFGNTFSVTVVPEPATVGVIGLGLVVMRRRRG